MNVGVPYSRVFSYANEEEEIFDPKEDALFSDLNKIVDNDYSDLEESKQSEEILFDDLNYIPWWHPDYKENNFIKVADFILHFVNPYLDLYRTSIPSNEEMLIRNLVGIKGEKILINELKQLDVDEELILQSPKEKNINSVRLSHSVADLLGVVTGLATATVGLVAGTRLKIIASLATGVGLVSSLALHRFANLQETAREYVLIRTKRLKDKIACIDSILADSNELELTNLMRAKINQLNISKLGLTRITNRCIRIYNNSIGSCDTSVHLPQGGLNFWYNVNHCKYSAYSRTVRDPNTYQWTRETVTEVTHVKTEAKRYYVPPNAIEKEIYRDIQNLKKQGHKIEEVV